MSREYTASCAVCGGPGEPECPHEGERLQLCIENAEKTWIESWIGKHREWATNNAINAVTNLFNKKKEARKQMYRNQVLNIPYFPLYQQHRGRPPLHPHIVADMERQLAQAEQNLRSGIDYDWKQCVIRYPDVLTHFYNQIKVPLPREPEQPFPTVALAGGGQPRPPSVVQLNSAMRPPPPPLSNVGASINRSATAPPKKSSSKRSSKVNGGLDEDTLALLSSRLESMGLQTGKEQRGRTKPATPAPPCAAPGPGGRPKAKRRESRDYSQLPVGLGAPPRAAPPPSSYGGPPGGNIRHSLYDGFDI